MPCAHVHVCTCTRECVCVHAGAEVGGFGAPFDVWDHCRSGDVEGRHTGVCEGGRHGQRGFHGVPCRDLAMACCGSKLWACVGRGFVLLWPVWCGRGRARSQGGKGKQKLWISCGACAGGVAGAAAHGYGNMRWYAPPAMPLCAPTHECPPYVSAVCAKCGSFQKRAQGLGRVCVYSCMPGTEARV